MSVLPCVPGVDLEAVLAPIDANAPAGINLRTLPKSVFFEIEGLLEGKGVHNIIVVDADGKPTSRRDESAVVRSVTDGVKRSIAVLTSQSKDLDVATLCAQGLLAIHGYAGLWCGLSLIRELHTRFWNSVHPNPPPELQTEDESGTPLPTPIPEAAILSERRVLSARLRAVDKLEYVARTQLKLAPLFVSDTGRRCCVADFEAAATGDADLTEEDLHRFAQGQSADFFSEQESLLASCMDECDRLDALLEKHYHRDEDQALGLPELDAPPFGLLRKDLEECLALVVTLRRQAKSVSPKNPDNDTKRTGRTEGIAGSKGTFVEAIRPSGKFHPKGRTECLNMLLAAAQFLHKHEPLSPIPRLLFQCLQWARGDSLRSWIEDMFRTTESEQEEVIRHLFLESDTKLQSERLPSGCPVPKDRAEALAMLADVAAELQTQEPLSPVPYRLSLVLSLTNAGTPTAWLGHVFAAESSVRTRIERSLGLGHENSAENTIKS